MSNQSKSNFGPRTAILMANALVKFAKDDSHQQVAMADDGSTVVVCSICKREYDYVNKSLQPMRHSGGCAVRKATIILTNEEQSKIRNLRKAAKEVGITGGSISSLRSQVCRHSVSASDIIDDLIKSDRGAKYHGTE